MFYESLKAQIQQFHQKSFKRKEVIYHIGDSAENIFLIESGIVGLFHTSESGKETFLRVFGDKQLFGHRSYFAQEDYHATAIALTQTEVSIIPSSECTRICHESLGLLKAVTQQLAIDLGKAELRLAGLQDKSAHKRVTESLVYLKEMYPKQVWTRKEIADYASSTFETVARVMTILEKKGYLAKAGRDFSLNNVQEMLSLAEAELH